MRQSVRATLLGVTSWAALLSPSARAQAPSPRQSKESAGLTEVVVTAQKRAQRLQDVPVSVTAINQATLQANRITSATDLGGIAPNVTVRPSAGSVGIPSFGIRGVVSYGVVPGSDKETSIYLDGVYIGAPQGSSFNLPDIQQIEVLRGPQGTLFGRNATAGAVSITTRDPSGVLGGRQEFTVGNYAQFRTRTSIDVPKIGPFSAYFSYVHNQRDGDIRNLGAGTVWDRTGPNTRTGVQVSPKTLGAHDINSYFAAVKYEPNDWFKTIYKFDYEVDNFTPDGTAATSISPTTAYLLSLAGVAPTYVLDPSGKRPDAVNNAFSVPGYQKTYGHNLTTTVQVNDAFSLKNVLGYRYAFVNTATQLDGLGGLQLAPQTPLDVLVVNNQTQSRQFSDELQANYSSHWLTLTSGLLFFHQNTVSGAQPGLANNFVFAYFKNGQIPLGYSSNSLFGPNGGGATSYNRAESLAAYSQAEIHVTSKIDIVGGVRVTDDKKSGSFVTGGIYTPGPGGSLSSATVTGLNYANFHYQQTKPAWTIGANYKPTHDMLIYAKYSDSFVSGGAIGGVTFKPETASSFEVGSKGDFLEHRLRVNGTLFDVEYRNLQSAQSGLNVGYPALGTVIVDQGNANAKGGELEVNARPINPITLGGSLGYTYVHYTGLTPAILNNYGGIYDPLFIPKWTVTLNAQYESDPMWHGARLVARVDANWHSNEQALQPFLSAQGGAPFAVLDNIPPTWIVNMRVALADIDFGGHTMEVAGWVKNLTNEREPNFPLALGGLVESTTFDPARTYGLDLNFKF